MAGEAYHGGSLCRVPSVAHSRTLAFRQTVLEALLQRGSQAVASVDGRYQIALFDAVDRTVTVMNDRFGGLPLFWAQSPEGVAFAGGVRGVLMAPGIGREPDAEAIQEAVTFGGFRLGDRTNIRGVRRLPGATAMTIGDEVSCRRYWTWPGAAPAGDRPAQELIEQAHDLWRRAIAVRLTDARRPGQTLSGGLDSRAILAEAAGAAPSWAAISYGATATCDDARYAQRASSVAGATWVFHPLYSGSSPDWLERRTSYIQQTDGLVQFSDLLHCESLHLQAALLDVHLSGYIGDVVCGTTYDGVVGARMLLEKLPFSGVSIGWGWDRAVEWAAATIRGLAPSAAKYAIYDHKFPQAIHLVFQSYEPYVRVRAPFTDYALFDFFAARPPETRAWLYRTWLAQKYPALFRWIPDQRTGLPIAAPLALIALERLRRGGVRVLTRALGAASMPAPRPRVRAYQGEERHWTRPANRERLEAMILGRDSLLVDIFGRDALARTLEDWFDRGLGPVQVVGALYTYEAYHRGLSAHLMNAARAARHALPTEL